MYKEVLGVVLFFAAIVTVSLANPLSLQEENEVARSLELWLEEDRREVFDGFLERLYESKQVGDTYERAQMAFATCDELELMTDNCSGNGQCQQLAADWYRCKCKKKYYGPTCDRKM